MATWWKKFSYSKGVKTFLILMLCLAGILIGNSIIGTNYIPYQNSYYETPKYQHEMIVKAGYVRDWIVRYADENIFNPSEITQEQIDAYKKVDPTITSDQEAKELIIKNRKSYFKEIQNNLQEVNLEYFAINRLNGQVITNRKDYTGTNANAIIGSFKDKEHYLKGDAEYFWSISANLISEGSSDYYYNGDGVENASDYEVYVGLKNPLVPGDSFYQDKTDFDRYKAIKDDVYEQLGIGIALAIVAGILWLIVAGQNEKGSKIVLNVIDQIPLEIQGVIYIGLMMMMAAIGIFCLDEFLPRGWVPSYSNVLLSEGKLLNLVFSCAVGITIVFVSSIVKHIKNRTLTDAIWTIRLIKWFFRSITDKTLPIVAIISIILYLFINFILMLFFINSYGFGFFVFFMMLVWFNGVVGAGLLKLAIDYKKLSKGIKDVAAGDLQAKVHLTYALPAMKETAQALNNIGEGLESAVERTLKSERFKTELITNVSHDLKTPLTSIISYIDLLKEEEIHNDTAKEYIEVLDERSNRLKQLVEDLVEASKAATGNVKAELIPTRIDQLVIQSVGEYTDRLENSNLAIVFNKMEEVSALVDGRHMCRIVENLLSNVCKYAMPNTRVYIDVIDAGDRVQFIVKNISKDPLAMDPNELTERFVRGEEARSTEGSGLGLAIASSLAEVQCGKLKLEIDGDLFKAVVEMSKVG